MGAAEASGANLFGVGFLCGLVALPLLPSKSLTCLAETLGDSLLVRDIAQEETAITSSWWASAPVSCWRVNAAYRTCLDDDSTVPAIVMVALGSVLAAFSFVRWAMVSVWATLQLALGSALWRAVFGGRSKSSPDNEQPTRRPLQNEGSSHPQQKDHESPSTDSPPVREPHDPDRWTARGSRGFWEDTIKSKPDLPSPARRLTTGHANSPLS